MRRIRPTCRRPGAAARRFAPIGCDARRAAWVNLARGPPRPPSAGAERRVVGDFSASRHNRTTFGRGCLAELGERAAALGMRRVALFSDASVAALAVFTTAHDSLVAAGGDVVTYH